MDTAKSIEAFTNLVVAEWKLRHEDRIVSRFPWSKLISDTVSFIALGCLPAGFKLREPEDLKAPEIAELWKHLHHRQQSGRVLGLEFTDKVIELSKKRGKDSSHFAIKTLDHDHTVPQQACHLAMLQDLIPLKLEDDLVHLPATTQRPTIDSGTVTSSCEDLQIHAVENLDASPSRVRYADSLSAVSSSRRFVL